MEAVEEEEEVVVAEVVVDTQVEAAVAAYKES